MTNTNPETMTAAEIMADDRRTWQTYRAMEDADWEAAGNTHWFDYRAVSRARAVGRNVPLDAYVGPYFAVRPYLNGEARDWFENKGRPRHTFAAWREIRAAQREAEAEAAREAARTAAVDLLAYGRELQARRGSLIVEARAAGIPWAEIAEATGLSRQACDSLAKAAEIAARDAEYAAMPYDPDEPF